MTREEELNQELAALQQLRRLEERREKSIRTVTRNRNRHYDKQRAELLGTLVPSVVERVTQSDPTHAAYLQRQGEPLDVEFTEEDVIEPAE